MTLSVKSSVTCSLLMSANFAAEDVPALLTRMSILPQRAATASTMARTDASSRTSVAMPTTSRPVVSLISAATRSKSDWVRRHDRDLCALCRQTLGGGAPLCRKCRP